MVNPNKTLYTTGYTVGQVPANPAELPQWLQNELLKVKAAIELARSGGLDPTLTAPAKPRQGLIVYATGAPYWDPGSGEGMYYYNSAGIWKLLG